LPTLPRKALIISHPKRNFVCNNASMRYTQTPKQLYIAWEGFNNIPSYKPDRIGPAPPELKPNYTILINPRKLTMVPKASLFKRATPTQEEHEIQLGSKIEDNNNIID